MCNYLSWNKYVNLICSLWWLFTLFCREAICAINLRCFVARPFLSEIYALLSVKFSGLKMCGCKKMTNFRYAMNIVHWTTMLICIDGYPNLWCGWWDEMKTCPIFYQYIDRKMLIFSFKKSFAIYRCFYVFVLKMEVRYKWIEP